MTNLAETTTEVRDWTIDAAHSTFEWAVRHMLVSTVKGAFAGVSGAIHYDPAHVAASSVRAEVQLASVDSHDAGRDEHLRGEGIFNVTEHPTATFVSTRVEPLENAGHFRVIGDLAFHGVTREVAFDTSWEGVVEQPNGILRAAFTARTTIRRTDFGFAPGRELPIGGLTTSDEVALTMYTTCHPA
jgi:polyisoprenoid-binding protein YceI